MKSWPASMVKNSLVTYLIFGLATLFCIYSFVSMPQSEDPVMDLPTIGVLMIYPGASAADIESQVAETLESSFSDLDNLKEIRSNINEGYIYMILDFDYGVDPDEKKDEVLSQISDVKDQLPDGIYRTEIIKYSTSEARIMQLALISSTAEYSEFNAAADNVKKEFERISDIKNVEVEGTLQEQVTIALDPSRMQFFKIGVRDIENAVKSYNANIPGGEINLGSQVLKIKTSGNYNNIEEIENTIVGNYNGFLVPLRDIADISLSYEDEKYIARHNGERAIFITAMLKKGGDIFSVREQLESRLQGVDLPENIHSEFVFDQAIGVNTRINGFLSNLVQGVILVGVICLLILGWKSSLLVMMAIPMSILAGLAITHSLGYTLNQITIAGLVIALGLLVDDAIAIIENTDRFIKKGKPLKKAAVKGATEIMGPAFSGTVTTILAFIPIVLVPDITGAFIRPMPVAVIATLIMSFLIAVLFLPVLRIALGRLDDLRKDSVKDNRPESVSETWMSQRINYFIQNKYDSSLRWVLNHKWLTMAYVLLFLILSFFIFGKIGTSFFPKADIPLFRVIVDLPQGSGLDNTEKVVSRVEDILKKDANVESITSNIGNGNPHIYYNMNASELNPKHADILVKLKSFSPSSFQTYLESLRYELAQISDAQVKISEFVQGPNSEAPLYIELNGDELNELKYYADEVESILQNHQQVINIQNPLKASTIDLYYDIKKEKAIAYGIPIHHIDETIRTMVAGKEISEYIDSEGEKYPIVLRHQQKDQISLDEISSLTMRAENGEIYPISNFMEPTFSEGYAAIYHKDSERIASLEADITSDGILDDIVEDLRVELDQVDWKEGYGYNFRGGLEAKNESFGNMAFASLLAFLLIFSVLVVQFNSFIQPWIIFSALFFALGGAFILLYITGVNISFTGFVGFTSLIGIAINNTIILIDFANRQLTKGKTVSDSILESAKVRFVPILLTTLTTILGLLPLTIFGGSFWKPMGLVIIGGLISSTILVLLVVPILYVAFTPKRKIKSVG